MRLIDADNLIKFFTNLEKAVAEYMVIAEAKKFVNEQPTVYDVDEVIDAVRGDCMGGGFIREEIC